MAKTKAVVESQNETPTEVIEVQNEVVQEEVVESQNETPTEVIEVQNEVVQEEVVQEEVVQEEVVPLSTQQEKIDKYFEYTGLKLDRNCHMDMEYLELWYQTKYLTKVVSKWAMKPGARIVHYVDGIIYKAANMTDEIAERLIKENPAYAEQFVQLN